MTVDPRCKNGYCKSTDEMPLTHPITLDWFMKNALTVKEYDYDKRSSYDIKFVWVYNLISRPKSIRAYLVYLYPPRFAGYGQDYKTYKNMDDAIKKINEAISEGKKVTYEPLEIVELNGHRTTHKSPTKKCPVTKMIGNIKGLENSVKRIF